MSKLQKYISSINIFLISPKESLPDFRNILFDTIYLDREMLDFIFFLMTISAKEHHINNSRVLVEQITEQITEQKTEQITKPMYNRYVLQLYIHVICTGYVYRFQ